MSISKQVLKSKPITKVSFKVSKAQADGANSIAILGEFNNWSPEADVMKALKNGSFSHTIELQSGNSYQFRYLADGERWFNDEEADGLAQTGMGEAENGVIEV